MKLSDQTVLITGAAGGIGRHLACDLAQDCSALVAIDKDAAALEDLTSSLSARGSVCDLTDFEAVQTSIKAVFEQEPAPTVLINNAGLIHSQPLVNLLSRPDPKHDVQTWRETIDANLNSVFHVSVCFAEQLVSRRSEGLIINVSSICAAGNAGQSAYSAAKAGVEALTVTWSKELGAFGIRCAAIAPGFIDTPSTQAAMSDANLEAWKKKTPLARLGDLSEVSSAVRFIIDNDFFNGRVLGLDGGLKL